MMQFVSHTLTVDLIAFDDAIEIQIICAFCNYVIHFNYWSNFEEYLTLILLLLEKPQVDSMLLGNATWRM